MAERGNGSLVRRVRKHPVPAWWSDAKLGIFVHWTPASVPAFAPTDDAIGELFAEDRPDAIAHSPYSEWYENSLRFPDSPVARHHREHYGDRPYRTFARDWEDALDQWDPGAWAAKFAATGARYVVLVTKHHDGYCLWPTNVRNPHVADWACPRDVVGEFAEAVRAQGMRFGVYYSGGLDWTFNDHPIGRVTDLAVAQPRGEYIAYAEAQVRELIARYRPSVLWNDISWPDRASKLAPLLTDYYSAVPDGVINDRFLTWSPAFAAVQAAPVRRVLDRAIAKGSKQEKGIIPPKPQMFDVRTPEYTVFDTIQSDPWECVRGIDKSFGHNRASNEADFLTRRELLWSIADIASKNGNLLLNVGPRGEDATIAPAQIARLDWLAEFAPLFESTLAGTRPWIVPEGRSDDADVRFVARDRSVFVVARTATEHSPLTRVTCPELVATPTSTVTSLSRGVSATLDADGLVITVEADASDVPIAVRVDGAVAGPARRA